MTAEACRARYAGHQCQRHAGHMLPHRAEVVRSSPQDGGTQVDVYVWGGAERVDACGPWSTDGVCPVHGDPDERERWAEARRKAEAMQARAEAEAQTVTRWGSSAEPHTERDVVSTAEGNGSMAEPHPGWTWANRRVRRIDPSSIDIDHSPPQQAAGACDRCGDRVWFGMVGLADKTRCRCGAMLLARLEIPSGWRGVASVPEGGYSEAGPILRVEGPVVLGVKLPAELTEHLARLVEEAIKRRGKAL